MTLEALADAPSCLDNSLVKTLGSLNAGRWMVLHTKSRQEKVVAQQLEARGVHHFLPLVDRVRLIRGRKSVARVPLFPGYVFLQGHRDDGFAAIASKRVCRVIDVRNQERFEHELDQVARALDYGAPLDLYPFAVEGRRCRVIRGPFHGLEGIVIERKRTARLVLQVDILGQGAALEVDADFLEPV